MEGWYRAFMPCFAREEKFRILLLVLSRKLLMGTVISGHLGASIEVLNTP